MKFSTIVALSAAALAGCTVGPDYLRPSVESPTAWRIDYPQAAEVANTRWWQQFGDPVLNDLVESALRESRDVRIAAERVEAFMGALSATGSQAMPQLAYSGDASRARASRIGQPPLPPGADASFNLYQGTLGASWQLDLFGRVRRLTEAAQAQVYASEQAKRGVVLSLVTNVATSYIVLRALDRQLEIAQATTRNFGATVRVFDLRFRAGVVSKSELMQVTSQYQQTLAAIPAFEQAIAAQENLISILLGRAPGPIARGKPIDRLVAPLIPAGLPSELLLRRPDILQAEQNLVATNANVGATRALYYPSFSITGAVGSTSTAFGSFLTAPSQVGLLAAGISGPLFTFGAIEGQVRSAEAQNRIALLAYQQTILAAFRETDDALTGSQKKIVESAAQKKRVESLREFARLSRLRFDKGLTGYVEVLVAENELFAAELASVNLIAARYAQLIGVYQAMGGGWVDTAANLVPQPPATVAAKAP